MSVQLCDVCQAFDVRQLLLLSEAQEPTWLKTTLAGIYDEDLQWKAGLPDFFTHHKSYAALEISSKLGCPLCNIIYERWPKSSKKSIAVDKAIDDAGLGQLFIGTSRCNISKGEIPVITVTQRPAGNSPRTLCTFDVCSERITIAWNESRYLGLGVSPQSDSEECKVTALEWLQECLISHPLCGPSKSFRDPSRLINVGAIEGIDGYAIPRLEESPRPSLHSWTALSYSWGGDSKFTLRNDTIHDLKRGVPIERWPGTLRDAIKITRNLGLKYIWIDALCILQDSKADWQAEASRMRDIYSGAAVTIIAAESQSSRSGIYTSRPPSGQTCELRWAAQTESKVWLRPSVRTTTDVAYTNPLQKRGWTLQEGLLAPRTLSFRKEQMVWECSNYRRTESGNTVRLDHRFDSKDLFHNKSRKDKISVAIQDVSFFAQQKMEEVYRQRFRIGWSNTYMTGPAPTMKNKLELDPYVRWTDIVMDYSQRNFTKDSDILPALGGVARAFADITKDKYCCGMWESELLQDLCWYRLITLIDKKKQTNPPNMDLTRPTKYRAPSWSWAGINGDLVIMSSVSISASVPVFDVAQVNEIYLQPIDDDSFGELKSGYLSIKGSLFELGDVWQHYWRNVSPSWEDFTQLSTNYLAGPQKLQYPSIHRFVIEFLNKGGIGTFEFEQQHIPHPEQKFVAFLLAYSEGYDREEEEHEQLMQGTAHLLILETTGRKSDEYRRIGIITIRRSFELSIIDPSVDRLVTRKWKEFSENQWREFENKTPQLAIPVVEAKAWIEVTKKTVKRIKICIV